MRKHHRLGAILAAVALAAGGGLAGVDSPRHRAGGHGADGHRAGGHRAGRHRASGSAAGSGHRSRRSRRVRDRPSSTRCCLPKFTGIAVFDQANEGAQEAAAELGAHLPSSSAPRPPTTASPGRSRS